MRFVNVCLSVHPCVLSVSLVCQFSFSEIEANIILDYIRLSVCPLYLRVCLSDLFYVFWPPFCEQLIQYVHHSLLKEPLQTFTMYVTGKVATRTLFSFIF